MARHFPRRQRTLSWGFCGERPALTLPGKAASVGLLTGLIFSFGTGYSLVISYRWALLPTALVMLAVVVGMGTLTALAILFVLGGDD